MTYNILKFAHIVVFGYWLGLQIAGYMIYSRYTRDEIPSDGRVALAEVHEPIALGGGMSWMPMLALGLALAHLGKWAFVGTGGAVLMWAASSVAAAWLGAQAYFYWARHVGYRGPAAAEQRNRVKTIQGIDTSLRMMIVLALFATGLVSIITGDPIAPAWLAWKVLLFALVVAITLGWRKFGVRRVRDQWVAAADTSDGSAPTSGVAGPARIAHAMLGSSLLLIVVVVWLAVAKPM